VQRVALFLPNLGGGGAERVMVNLARGFADRGLSVDLVLLKAEGVYLSEVPPQVRIVDLRTQRAWRSLLPLVRYLRRERPVALISTSSHCNVVALLAKRVARVATRTVVRQAEAYSMALRLSPPKGLGQLIPFLVPRLYPCAHAIVAGSRGVATDLARATGLPLERIRITPNPVVTPELFLMAKEPLDHPWFAAGECPVILGAGRLTKQKDLSTLIRAFARLRRARTARLVILGDGEERPLLEALVKDLDLEGSVSLPGFVRNPFAFMARAAVFVLSSKWEGLPGVLIQALACGAPAVATDCESGPRDVLRGGRFGRLVPIGDVAALADAILSTLDAPKPLVPREAWRAYSQDAAVDNYLSILQANGHG
jgi:glycosyltransferase involved in cell wall biosynthesis